MRALLMKSKGGGAPITTAGIYHSPDLGLISLSSDGTNWTTIADKNLGATQVYNDGDTMNNSNVGNFYQRGNNYGFPYNWVGVQTISNSVNAGNFGPGNYYSDNTFRKVQYWDSSKNNNLWGDITNTDLARQGPCNSGFHVPNKVQFNNLFSILTNLGITSGNDIAKNLKMPFAGGMGYNENRDNNGSFCIYYTTSAGSISGTYIYFYIGPVNGDTQSMSGFAYPIRPFKNTPVQPDDGGDWETLYINYTLNNKNKTKSFGANVNQLYPIIFLNGGNSLIGYNSAGTTFEKWNVSTPWDITTATSTGSSYNWSYTETRYLSKDNKHIFKADNDGYIRGYNITFSNNGMSVSANGNIRLSSSYKTTLLCLSDDGTKMYAKWGTGGVIHQYNLSTAWRVDTATETQSIGTTYVYDANGGSMMEFSSDGSMWYIALGMTNNNYLFVYRLSTPWDISTATLVGKTPISTKYGGSFGNNFKYLYTPRGGGMYVDTYEIL